MRVLSTALGQSPRPSCACWGAVLFTELTPLKIQRPCLFTDPVLLTPELRLEMILKPQKEDSTAQPMCSLCRNKDFQEVTLERNGEVLLRFAAAYGFRNIQNVVLKLKKGKFPYHFVEVLACAGGKARPHSPCRRRALLTHPKLALHLRLCGSVDAAPVAVT